jgi:CheY-like chemotaxis protein
MSLGASTGSRTILIVDDEVNNREILRDLLEDDGFKVLLAEDGHDGLRKSTQGVGAILMDVLMPQMDGLTTCRRLNANETTRNIPVIFLSACPEEQIQQAAFRVGAYDFLHKPVRASELRAKLGAVTQIDPAWTFEQRRARYQELVQRAQNAQAAEETAAINLLDEACLTEA